jgi:hypothetical protein
MQIIVQSATAKEGMRTLPLFINSFLFGGGHGLKINHK